MIVWVLGLYQATARFRQPRCRFVPTCSQYAVEAVSRHGAARGLWYGVRRLLRCHPWNAGGIDDVPPRLHERAH